MSLCRSCGQKIEWIETKTGKKMPVDPDYVEYEDAEEGTVLITHRGNTYKVDRANSYASVKGRISHFATCKQSDNWRKKQMTTLIESINKTKVHQWTIRCWREQKEGFEATDIDPDVEEILENISPERSASYIAHLLLAIDRMNAVEVLSIYGNGLVVYKNWP